MPHNIKYDKYMYFEGGSLTIFWPNQTVVFFLYSFILYFFIKYFIYKTYISICFFKIYISTNEHKKYNIINILEDLT